jgi:integrase
MRWAKRRRRIEAVPLFPTVHVPRRVPAWLDEASQLRILEEIPGEHRGVFMFAAYHGARMGEARALQWSDIEWGRQIRDDNGKPITVDVVTTRRAYSRGILKETKPGRERQVLLHPDVRAWIQAHRVINPQDLVFVKADGSRYRRNHLGQIWAAARDRAEVDPRVRAYDGTRHSFPSQHVSAGGSIYDLREVMGHADIRTTLIYAHSDLRSSLRTIIRRGKVVELPKRKGKRGGS